MAFGQQSGPPASKKQVTYLESLLKDAGFASFREARHPLDLTQRQAGGKFSKGEASELIDKLLSGEIDSIDLTDNAAAEEATSKLRMQRDELVAGIPADVLVEELERRGWICKPPPE
jgi:hypothetical protein